MKSALATTALALAVTQSLAVPAPPKEILQEHESAVATSHLNKRGLPAVAAGVAAGALGRNSMYSSTCHL